MASNRYAGACTACGKLVRPGGGVLERKGRVWVVWCMPCYDESDMSGVEDRECGLRAYEDRCAEIIGREHF